MNRADLAWALQATLPHVGQRKGPFVGFSPEGDGTGFIYAFDSYAAGVARVLLDPSDRWPAFALSTAEAKDLHRFVKPTRKAHDAEQVRLLVDSGELHVGLEEGDSEVYDIYPDQEYTLESVLNLCRGVAAAPVEHREVVFQPALLGKFGKASREPTDRLRLYPHHTSDRYGAALVTVGTDFIGAVAGLEYDDVTPEILTVFLQHAGTEQNRSAA
jgi:hypothetical protein